LWNFRLLHDCVSVLVDVIGIRDSGLAQSDEHQQPSTSEVGPDRGDTQTGETQTAIMSVTQLSMDHTSVQTYHRPVTPLLLSLRSAARMSVPWPKEFPTELVFEVFKYLPQADLARACLVSRYCNPYSKCRLTVGHCVASDSSLWTDLDLSNLPMECRTRLPRILVKRLKSAGSLTLSGKLGIPQPILRETMALISQSPRLTSLSLYSAVEVTEAILIDLFTHSVGSLKHVDISFCYDFGSDAIISLVTHHPNLLTLNVSHTSLDDKGLLTLHRLHQLTDLSLEGCFNLTRTSMSQFLQNGLPPRLSRLNLSYLFTVLGEWLASLNKLERLDVRHAENITKRDVRGFRERWGSDCEVLSTAKLETDDEHGWRQFVDEIIRADVVVY
jgi:hypothetical protein